jgi:hypothetical protein
MNSKRLYFLLLSGFVLLVLVTAGVAYGANTLLASQSKKLAEAKATNQALDNQSAQLKKNKNDILKYGELNKIAQTIVPQDKDQAEAIREITNLAQESGIGQLSSITFPASTLGTTAAGNKITQVTPVKGIPGVYDLQITVTQDSSRKVSYDTFITFLSKLEQNRRTAQVSSITVQPDSNDPSQVAFTLVLDEFIKP